MNTDLNPEEFRKLQTGTARMINVHSTEYLFFSGTDYLGIAQNEAFKNLYIEGIQQWGFNNGTSRNNNVQLDIYNIAENNAAQRYGAENAIVSSSGYLAAQLVVQHFHEVQNWIFSPQTHPAIWLNKKPVVGIQDFEEWKKSTIKTINESKENKFVVVSNAVDPQTPAILNFEEFNQIDVSKEVILIIDDSHGIGFTRNNGKGVYETLPQTKNIQSIVVASMAKGLGIRAGVILGTHAIIESLRKTGMYIGASPASPASLHAYIHGESIYEKAYQQLIENNQYFRSRLPISLNHVPELPIYVSDNENLFEVLKNKHILISSFSYPSATDPLLNRIIINSAHTQKDIDQLVKALQS